ncbi:nucleolar protein 10 [Eupeodes corollae]|uniref:nucleolar protein 10 n=1 Tax=Eupeodes corollae TaxID=290404 RepID=UPI0024912C5F|nr:nucleolar protein 10 [Eupeodes corollae]
MFVSDVNDVKVYNLSAGKSVPEWLTDRRKRSQLMKKVDSRRQIELIQDFDMPGVSTSIRMSPDNQYILATGTYKPRVKCFEVSNLSIKFERCFDSEVTTFEVLSDDYSKMVFLQCDRYIEIHAAHGRHYRLRIPRFGRDMKYHSPSCDLFIVGTSSDIFRLNLERGQFLQPFESEASCSNVCEINPEHHLLMVGTKEGTVEAWDPRDRRKCATVDVAMKFPTAKKFPSVTAMKFKNGLQMAVGTATGHVLIYDIRSREPLFVKDHLNKLPIKRLGFNPSQQSVYSLDSAMFKVWDETSGKQTAYVESTSNFNDFCTIPDSGMFFFAQEDVKMLTYYIPSMGPAPRWCSFLDNLTEEIESEVVENMYDDYQFITQKELEELGMEELIGTKLLKAYMHGYFIDARLYNKFKATVEPFAFDKFRKEKIRQEIATERQSRLQIKTHLPKVNTELALKIIEEESSQAAAKAKNKKLPNLLEDDRFKAMFENTDFAINKNTEEYKMLAPALNRMGKIKTQETKKRIEVARVAELHADEAKPHEESDDDDDLFNMGKSDGENDDEDKDKSEESSDDEDPREFSRQMKKAYKDVKRQRAQEDENDDEDDNKEDQEMEDQDAAAKEKPASPKKKLIPHKNPTTKFKLDTLKKKTNRMSLQDRVRKEQAANGNVELVGSGSGNRQMHFETKKPSRDAKKREFEMKKHREERKKVIRPIKSLKLKKVNFK